MNKWFSKAIEYNINLSNLPNNGKYSPIDPIVKGDISINFIDEIKKVTTIKYGLRGDANIIYYVSDIPYGNVQLSLINRQIVSQGFVFFDTFNELDLNCKEDTCSKCDNFDDNHDDVNNNNENNNVDNNNNNEEEGIKTFIFKNGDNLKANFEFEFPNTVYLPSSIKDFGNINCSINISYSLYVEIYKLGGFLSTKSKKISCDSIPIFYQSGVDPLYYKNISNLKYKETNLFENKIKKFYYDDNQNALIPTSLNKSHSKTKFIRKLWNNEYKDENYKNITKSIPLTIELSTKSFIDMSLPFSTQFTISLISDLKSIGFKSNKTTDFVLNNQSTNLGVFQIESLTVESTTRSKIKCQNYIMKSFETEIILKINFKNLKLDIKDFEYDKDFGCYKIEIPAELLQDCSDVNLNESLLNLLNDKTVIPSGIIPDWFENNQSVSFTWKISDGFSQKKKILFDTNATLDFLIDQNINGNFSNYDSVDFVPPPTYENSKIDEKVEH